MKQYQFFLDLGNNYGTSFSITSARELAEAELGLLKLYLARSFQRDKLKPVSQLETKSDLLIIGPNLRHATPESAKRVEAVQSGGLTSIRQIELFKVYLNGAANGHKPDRMLESAYTLVPKIPDIEVRIMLEPEVPFMEQGDRAINEANLLQKIGLVKFDIEQVILPMYKKKTRNPTLSELFTIAVVNSEHGRHHTMNAIIEINGERQDKTMFQLIKEPFLHNNGDTVVGFADNSSALKAFKNFIYMNSRIGNKAVHFIYSAETHNYPSTIESFHGAITGVDGEFRDIWAMRRGGQILFAVSGYAFGNLGKIADNYYIPGEGKIYIPFPTKIEKPLDAAMKMTKGVAMGGNEVGYPTNVGYTRSFGDTDVFGKPWSFWKVQLFAAATGYTYGEHINKLPIEPGMKVYMIGGPAYLIGKGGSQNSSKMQGELDAELDWNGVQRGNPFMSRKLAEAVCACVELGEENPTAIKSDQGAGGIGNVLAELVAPHGALLDFARVTLGDPNLTHSDIWTAEYQERLAFVIRKGYEKQFEAICKNEKLNCECLGEITGDGKLVVIDSRINKTIIDLELADLFANVPQQILKDDDSYKHDWPKEVQLPQDVNLKDALLRVLKRVEVGSKDWHLRFKDHSVGGKVVTNQYAGIAQIPINDYALSLLSQHSKEGGLLSIGEQPIIMIMNPQAGVRLSVVEALANGAGVVKSGAALQANEMVAVQIKGELARTYEMIKTGRDTALELHMHYDGGKDSTRMAVTGPDGNVVSPPTFVVSHYATVDNVAKRVSAHFAKPGSSRIIAVNLSGSKDKYRLGASPLMTAYDMTWNGATPDVDDLSQVNKVLAAVSELVELGYVTACHDTIGDGRLVSVLEMALAGGCGANMTIDTTNTVTDPGADPLIAKAFAQEAWLILEVPNQFIVKKDCITEIFEKHGVERFENIGSTTASGFTCTEISTTGSKQHIALSYSEMWNAYNSTSSELKKERIRRASGNVGLVAQEKEFWKQPKSVNQRVWADFGKLSYAAKLHKNNQKQAKALVLRAEGSNGQEELGFMFEVAGFDVTYANMEMLLRGDMKLKDFQLLLLPGGFSFGDLFGSGVAWAMQFKNSFLMQDLLDFIARPDTLIFGVCNGYQALAELEIMYHGMPSEITPKLVPNQSNLFEHHLNYVTIPSRTNTVMLKDMEGWILPIYSAHGEGAHYFVDTDIRTKLTSSGRAPLRFANANGKPTGAYPCNPNGSFHGIAGMVSANGRILGMMPHPERIVLADNLPYMPKQWEGNLKEYTPWVMMAYNAYNWCVASQKNQ